MNEAIAGICTSFRGFTLVFLENMNLALGKIGAAGQKALQT